MVSTVRNISFLNFSKDGEYLHGCANIISVYEIIRYNNIIIDSYVVRYDFNNETKILKLINAVSLSFMEIEVTYNIDNFELRRIKIKKLLNG